MADKMAVIVCRARPGRPGAEDLEQRLIQALKARPGLEVMVTAHLYDLPADSAALGLLRSIRGDMVVLSWLYPRAAYWILDSQGIKARRGRTFPATGDQPEQLSGRAAAAGLPERTIWCLDLRTNDRPEHYVEQIARIARQTQAASAWTLPAGPQADQTHQAPSPRWYPVIDYDRCTNCLECLNFCLFGVYGLDEAERIVAEQPDACRPGCPACARICPAGAIIFPQHSDPAIAGDPQALSKALKLDLSQLFGASSAAELAAAERDRALAEKQAQQPADSSQAGGRPGGRDELDRLVDQVDDLDL